MTKMTSKCHQNDVQLMTEDGWIGGTGTVTIDETGRNIVTLGERNPQRP